MDKSNMEISIKISDIKQVTDLLHKLIEENKELKEKIRVKENHISRVSKKLRNAAQNSDWYYFTKDIK